MIPEYEDSGIVLDSTPHSVTRLVALVATGLRAGDDPMAVQCGCRRSVLEGMTRVSKGAQAKCLGRLGVGKGTHRPSSGGAAVGGGSGST